MYPCHTVHGDSPTVWSFPPGARIIGPAEKFGAEILPEFPERLPRARAREAAKGVARACATVGAFRHGSFPLGANV